MDMAALSSRAANGLPSMAPLFVPGSPDGELKPKMYSKEGCQGMKEGTKGILDETLLSQDSGCVLWGPPMCLISHHAFVRLTCLLKRLGLEALSRCQVNQ